MARNGINSINNANFYKNHAICLVCHSFEDQAGKHNDLTREAAQAAYSVCTTCKTSKLPGKEL